MKTETYECLPSEVLSQYLRGELSDAQAEQIENHLENCSNCMSTVSRELDKDAFCKTVLESGKRRVDLASMVDRVANLKARLAPLWPGNRGQPSPEDASTVDPAPESSNASVPTSAGRLSAELGWVDNYRILAEIGRGGMGVVYRAEDPVLSRQVAVKMIKPKFAADDRFRQRFLREARCMAAVSHENIVPIFHVGGEKNPYFVMPLLCGRTLEARLEAGLPLTAAEVLQIGSQIADGLSAAHHRNLIHRDLKPANLWLDEKGVVKILDFGLAQDVDSLPSAVPGGGTPKYMSPEQQRGLAVTLSTDLYSLGVVLFRLGTGQFPEGESTRSSANAKSLRDEGFPERAVETIMQMLDPEPNRRPASARVVAKALRGGQKSRWWPVLAAAAVVLCGLIGIGWFLLPRPEPPVYRGHFDVVLRPKEKVAKKDTLLGDPGYLSIHLGDHGHLEMDLEQGPAAYFYVIRIDTRGNATPMFPEGWTWDNLPSAKQETPRKSLRWPAEGEEPFQDTGQGFASYLWLVRGERLTMEQHSKLKTFLTTELRWTQPEKIDDEVYLFQNGKLTQDRGGILADHPVRQTEATLLRIKNDNLAAYSRAICYPFRKP